MIDATAKFQSVTLLMKQQANKISEISVLRIVTGAYCSEMDDSVSLLPQLSSSQQGK